MRPRCLCDFGVDMSRSHEEVAAEYARLEYEAANALTPTARRKALTQLRRLAMGFRLGGPSGGPTVIRSAAQAVGANYEVAWEEARQAGRAAKAQVPPDAWFPMGFATLVTSDKAFAKVLVQHGEPDLYIHADALRKVGYLRGYGFSVVPTTGGLPEQEAFCRSVVEVLKRYGIDTWCHTRWD